MKKFISFFLSVAMMLSFNIMSSARFDAPNLTRAEWDALYEANYGDNTLPTLNVGADETEISICWHADKATAKPEVLVSESSNMSDAITFSGRVTKSENEEQVVCRVVIDGLKENTVYYYQWNTDDGLSEVFEYETKEFKDHKVLVVGDIQIPEDWRTDGPTQSDVGYNWNNVLAEALMNNPDISYLVSPGDNTSTGQTAAEWQTLLTPASIRSLPMALAIGNHDKKGMTYEYYTNMPNEYYGENFYGLDRDFWFRYGDVLYLFYDSTSGNAPDHLAMTEEAIAQNSDAKWRIGVVHHGIYGAGDCIGDAETEILLSTIFTPIFESFDFDLVITGHTHSQGRSHFMDKNEIVGLAESGKTYTNPRGTIYLNANAVCEKVIMDYEADYLAYSFMENDVTTYTTLDFEGDTMTLETRRGDNSELLDSITITRDIEFNEDDGINKFQRFLYGFVEILGYLFTKVTQFIDGLGF